MSRLKIGNVTLDSNVILAPMAGVTDMPFRLLCREQGAGLVCMEMVSAKAIYYGNKNTEELLTIHSKEAPASLQLFGSDPEIIAEMAKQIEDRPFAILDFNMGCPVPKVVNNNEHCNAVEIAKIAEDCGVAAVAVHGRTREQYYSGHADWEVIAQVKDAIKIPVIGNGDIDSPLLALSMMRKTNCDGVMIGRAAQGNPWIFRDTVSFLEDGTIPDPPAAEEKREMILRHAELLREFKGEYTAVREMRKHLSWYTVGMPHSAKFRQIINSLENMGQLLGAVDTIFNGEGIK